MYHVLIAVARSARLDHCLNFTHLVKPNAFRFTQLAGIRTSHLHCVPRGVRPLAWTKTNEGGENMTRDAGIPGEHLLQLPDVPVVDCPTDLAVPMDLSPEQVKAQLTSLALHLSPERLPANVHLPDPLSQETPDPLHMQIRMEMSSNDILDLIHTSHRTMEKIEYAVAMRQLYENSLSNDLDVSKHPGFHILCALLALKGRFYVEGRLVQQLLGHMIRLGLDEGHPTVQIYLQLMKTHINDLHLHELLQFCSDLKYLSSSPQVDLLLKGAALLVNINGTEPISTLTPVEAVIMMYVFGSHSDIDPVIIEATSQHLLREQQNWTFESSVGLFEAFAYNQETSQPTSNSVNQQLYDYCSHHLISELHLRYNDDNIDLVIPEAENLLRCCEILNQSQLSTWHICDAIGQLIKRYSIEFRAVWLIGLCDLFASLSFASEHFVGGLLNILPASSSAMENYFMQFESGSLSSVIYLLCNTHHINASNWDQFVLTFLCDHVCKHRDKFSTDMFVLVAYQLYTVKLCSEELMDHVRRIHLETVTESSMSVHNPSLVEMYHELTQTTPNTDTLKLHRSNTQWSEAEYSAVCAELYSFVGDSVVTQQMCCDEELPYCLDFSLKYTIDTDAIKWVHADETSVDSVTKMAAILLLSPSNYEHSRGIVNTITRQYMDNIIKCGYSVVPIGLERWKSLKTPSERTEMLRRKFSYLSDLDSSDIYIDDSVLTM